MYCNFGINVKQNETKKVTDIQQVPLKAYLQT